MSWFFSISVLRKRLTKKKSLLFWVLQGAVNLRSCSVLFLSKHGHQCRTHSDLIHTQVSTLESHISKVVFLCATFLGHNFVLILWFVTWCQFIFLIFSPENQNQQSMWILQRKGEVSLYVYVSVSVCWEWCWSYACFIQHGVEVEGVAGRGLYSTSGRILVLMWELQDIVCALPPPTLPPVHKNLNDHSFQEL